MFLRSYIKLISNGKARMKMKKKYWMAPTKFKKIYSKIYRRQKGRTTDDDER